MPSQARNVSDLGFSPDESRFAWAEGTITAMGWAGPPSSRASRCYVDGEAVLQLSQTLNATDADLWWSMGEQARRLRADDRLAGQRSGEFR
jgi:hypothetical protein